MAETKRQRSAMTKERYERPANYDVIVHDDDFTTMDFVVKMLRQVFFLPEVEAVDIMLNIHNTGKGVAGSYILDIAKSKAQTAMRMARAEGFPLKVTIEKDELPF